MRTNRSYHAGIALLERFDCRREVNADALETLKSLQQRCFKRWLVKCRDKPVSIPFTGRRNLRKEVSCRYVVCVDIQKHMFQYRIAQTHCLADAQTFIIKSDGLRAVTQARVAFENHGGYSCCTMQI